ncbi:hypothetical protein [Mycobacterium gordonae]|uniref:DUF7257 domain-containing protein n=1 Tax=Mycobacterium gordonae TaxID=1778 RepID=A0A1X1VIN6_MYCGO|nr:hypothetical protein [Mycobacterium gordonae]MCV7009498.1 hypothetical protein [Mycobacterium gordonae]ODR15925.1 hypothetical protein BHQ23_31790 [Mycobacterium gordonae]ORV68904.1 hypothetical protein AWC08_06835 [Mycobacterium gordonae]
MTTPSGFTPIGAANAAGLAAFAAKGIEDWRQQATTQWQGALGLLQNGFENLFLLIGQIPVIGPLVVAAAELVQQLIDALVNALGYVGSLFSVSSLQSYWTTALQNLNAVTGAFDAGGLTGGINTAVTIGGQAVSSIFNGSGQFIGVLNSAATGALNSAITVGGTTLSTLFTNINSSGQLLLSGATGALNTAVTIGGQAVSSLFNGSGQFIGVINSAATGALNTALTVGGASLSTLFTNINSSGQLLGAGITGAINTAATVAGQTVGTIQANAQGLIEGINNAAVGLLSGGSTLLADAQTNLNLLLTAPAQFLQGATGLFGIVPTQNAYAAAAAAAAAQAANLAQQTSAFNAVFNVSPAAAGNVSVTVDFSGMSNASNMSGVMSPGNTNIGITSGVAKRQVGTAGSDAEVFPTQTTSDYQVITATLGNLNDSNPAYTEVCGRVNSARTTRVTVAILSSNELKLGCWVSGAYTTFASNSLLSMSTGGLVELILGDPSSSSPYAMQVLYNGTPVITYTDSSHVSQLGASYLYVGLAMALSSGSGKYPPAIRTVSYQDNPPAPSSYPFSGTPTAGTKGRMYVSNDVGLIQRDNGSAWEYIWGGPLGYFTKPPSSGWSWVNQGTATTATELGGERITAPSSTRNMRLRTRSLSPASNYSATAYLEASVKPATNRMYSGIGLRNSSSGSFITFGPSYQDESTMYTNLAVIRWTNATTVSAVSWQMGLLHDQVTVSVTRPDWPVWS